MITTTRTISVILACLLLSSCGGGSSSSTPSLNAALSSAAQNRPSFGSVIQSSNFDRSGSGTNSRVTTDSGSTTWDGSLLNVEIQRVGKDSIRFNNSANTANRGSVTGYQYAPGDPQLQGHITTHSVKGMGFWTVTPPDTISLAAITVSWDSTDSTDYFAGGYWLYLKGDVEAQEIVNAEVGAFMDGPELDKATALPDTVTGSATYNGFSAGLYVSRPAGTSNAYEGEIGEYTAPLNLNVNFDTDAITACLGCNGVVRISALQISADGVVTGKITQEDVQLHMTASTINPDGTFEGTVTSFQSPGATATASGIWGGKFSNKLDTAGDGRPRLVAGTNAAEIEFSDGATTSLVGAFYGIK